MTNRYDRDIFDELLEADVSGTDIVGARAEARRPEHIEHLLVGIPVTSIAAASEATVNVPVQKPFRARRLILAGTTSGVRLKSLKVSNTDQFINSSPIPAAVFAADAVGARLRGDTAQPGVGIDLRVENTTTAAVDLEGGFFGEAAT